MDALANLFKALADETRLRILGLLQLRGELCVCDVEGALGITQSKSSRHLRYLLNAGLVQNRRAGAWVFYRLADAPGPEQRRLLTGLAELLSTEQRAELQRLLDEWFARKAGSVAGCCTS